MIIEITKKALKKGFFVIYKIPVKIIMNIISKTKSCFQSLKFKYNVYFNRDKRVKKIRELLKEQDSNYLGICHPNWIGVKNSTKDTFGNNVIEIPEIYNEVEAKLIAKEIILAGKKMVAFNAFAYGWEKIMKALKIEKNDIIVRLVVHGSNALLSEPYDWDVYKKMISLYNEKIIDQLVFVKKSLFEFYKKKGYNTLFLMNDVIIKDKEKYIVKNKNNDKIKIGFYTSGDRWVKNTYNQLSAISLIDNCTLDCVAINEKISTMSQLYNINLSGEWNSISREELYERLAKNDINVYVTFTECAPLIPLESLELGTLCITGNNHHYFEDSELENYLVVNRVDNIMDIYQKINFALEHKAEIFEIYKCWKEKYSKEVQRNREEFFNY